MDEVLALGATYEGINATSLAVDIPPGVELAAVATYFISHGMRWEHADPTYESLSPGDERREPDDSAR